MIIVALLSGFLLVQATALMVAAGRLRDAARMNLDLAKMMEATAVEERAAAGYFYAATEHFVRRWVENL